MSGNEKEGLDASDSDFDPSDEDDEAVDAETETEAEQPADDAEEATEAEPTDDESEADEAAGPQLDEDVMPDEQSDADLLIPVEDYLGAGVHIGTQQKTQDMVRFIHRVRDDGLYVLDVSETDARIRTAADFLRITAGADPGRVVAPVRPLPGREVRRRVGARVRTGRFIPGTLTNPDYAGYIEPDVVVVTDPIGDAQAVKEAITVGIPVIAMCDSNNQTSNVDLVVPTNNKGRRALSVVYWLLANETLDRRGAEPSTPSTTSRPNLRRGTVRFLAVEVRVAMPVSPTTTYHKPRSWAGIWQRETRRQRRHRCRRNRSAEWIRPACAATRWWHRRLSRRRRARRRRPCRIAVRRRRAGDIAGLLRGRVRLSGRIRHLCPKHWACSARWDCSCSSSEQS